MEKISAAIIETVKKIFDVEVEPEVSVAPEDTGADFATNVAMKLAKVLHKAPMQIAEEICGGLILPEFEVRVAAPGFVNFISRDEYLAAEIADFGRNFEKVISQGEYSGKSVVCEFSDPNPFKVLHVGHLYTSIMGEAISRMIENAGGEVHRANFGGDVGLHVAKTLYALASDSVVRTCRKSKLQQAEASCNFGTDKSGLNLIITPESLAKAYVQGTRLYEEDEGAKAKIVALNKEIYDIALNDKHDSELAELYWKGREISYQYFEDFYGKIGVKFEKYYPESTVAERGLAEVKKGLEAGVYEESDGAIVYRGEKVGLHTRVFVNAAGLPTYEAKDVGLIFTKWDDYHFDKSVVITGNDIIEYMKVVLSSVREMKPELAERTMHITHGNVRLPGNEKMSSRKGNFLKAVDVLEMVRSELAAERGAADEKIVMAAVKYAFLKYKIGGNIIFDAKESVSMTGNSGPYVLYAVVRGKKILAQVAKGLSDNWTCRKPKSQQAEASCNFGTDKSGLNLIKLSDRPLRNLSKKLLQYRNVVGEATMGCAPHILCNYLFDLAQEFSRFYEKVQVAGSEDEAERAQLVKIFVQVMEHGLGLLGIEVPEEM